jgi:homopolymeric O-antigen transport system permease protein
MRSALRYAPARRSATSSWLTRLLALLRDYALDLAIVLTAYLVATYWRQELPFGRFVGYNYEWHTPRLYVTVALGLAAAYSLRILVERSHPIRVAPRFLTLLAGLVLICVGLTLYLPYQSGLQKAYFVVIALALSFLSVPIRDNSQGVEPVLPLRANLAKLWANRSLLRIWVQYNVLDRYSQAILGVLWIILLPLSTAFVMSVVFSQIMRIHTGAVPFIAFFLSAFVPWGLFSQSISAGMRSILGAMGLINQIYFPREIIVLSALGEALVDAFFMFAAMLVIDAIVGVLPNGMFVVLPVLLLIQVAFMLGLMFIVSWLSVIVRDIPQLISVLLQILFYLSPIIYPVSIIPHRFQFLVNLNPIALLVQAYRDVIVYNRQPDWFSLVYPAALGVTLLIFGYRHFKANEDRFADML